MEDPLNEGLIFRTEYSRDKEKPPDFFWLTANQIVYIKLLGQKEEGFLLFLRNYALLFISASYLSVVLIHPCGGRMDQFAHDLNL